MNVYNYYKRHANEIYNSKAEAWKFTNFAIKKLNIKNIIETDLFIKNEQTYLAYFEKFFFYKTWKFFFIKKNYKFEKDKVFYRIFKKLLNTYNPGLSNNIIFNSKKNKKKGIKYFLKNIIVKIFNLLFYSKNKNNKLAVTLLEGLNLSIRNDLFWYNHLDLKNKNILFYIEDLSILTRLKGIIFLILKYKLKGYNFYLFSNEINEEIILNKDFTDEEFIKNHIYHIKNCKNKWIQFFKNNKVVIHQENAEHNFGTIYRQIACKELKISSFSKCRSVIMPYLIDWINYHNCDYFFVWNKNIEKRIKQSNNIKSKIINIGKFYFKNQAIFSEEKLEIGKINSKIKVLINLSNFSDSNLKSNYDEYLPRFYLKNFFRLFLRIAKVYDVKFIVKCKKNSNEFYNITHKLDSRSNINKYFYTIKNPFQKLSFKYDKYVDFTINFGIYLPSVMLENLLYNETRSVFIDYPNIKNNEQQYFKSDLNDLFFNEIKSFAIRFINYLNNDDEKIGDWSKDFGDLRNSSSKNNHIFDLLKKLHSDNAS